MTRTTAVRELLRDVLGDEAVDTLSDAALGRILGALFMTARREIERQPGADQEVLELAA